MAEVVICSLVRNGRHYLPHFRRQLEALDLRGGLSWTLCLVEGDSQDGSDEFITRWAAEDSRVIPGQEQAGDASTLEDLAARWAVVGNACFDLIPRDSQHTHVLWIEADLCFPPELLHRLLSRQVDVVAPVIWMGGFFYDGWGFRGLDGVRWRDRPPFHRDYKGMTLIEMQSVGSCVLFRRAVLDAGIRFRGTYYNGLLVGMCQDARAAGFRIFADTGTAILHPVDYWEAQMWRCRGVRLRDLQGETSVVRAEDLQGLGVNQIIPTMDADFVRRAQFRFWQRLFMRFDTHRIQVTLHARSYPDRSYEMTVVALPPRGIMAWGRLRRWVVRQVGPPDRPSPSRLQKALARSVLHPYQCELTIEWAKDPS